MQIDEIAYLDQLHEAASNQPRGETWMQAMTRDSARRKFAEIVFGLWPEISATFNEHKHSL